MAKPTTVYRCTECQTIHTRKPMGKCSNCGSFQTFVEEATTPKGPSNPSRAGLKTSGAVKPLKRAATISELNSTPIQRTKTGINELDRVLGGGFVDAEVVLCAGQPGAGKSTLALAMAERFAALGRKVLYSSGEESEQQIGLRAQRMGVSNPSIRIINETNLETLLGHIDAEKPDFLIVDSLQTLASTAINSSIGSVAQSKEAAHTLTHLAKTRGITMFLINQIVKSGEFSGSESIQHIVDAALMLESDSETPLKFLRATKNRFGDTTEVGVFQHAENGLQEVTDPSGILLETDDEIKLPGTACSFISEGIRQIPVEIQSLVTSSNLPTPRKQFSGVNYNRGQIVCAILDKFCNTRLYENDVFMSTVSGIHVKDPLTDLALAAAILSSLKEKPFMTRTAFVGELSLTGQVRGSFMVEQKVKEAERLRFERIIVPKFAQKHLTAHINIQINTITSIKELGSLLGS